MDSPQKPICATLLICEKILNENSVLSAIRIVDLFRLRQLKGDADPVVELWLAAFAKFPIGDSKTHKVQIDLVRPDGSSDEAGETHDVPVDSKYPDSPGGFNAIIKLVVTVKQFGLHYLIFKIDGQEVYRTPFTLTDQPLEAAD